MAVYSSTYLSGEMTSILPSDCASAILLDARKHAASRAKSMNRLEGSIGVGLGTRQPTTRTSEQLVCERSELSHYRRVCVVEHQADSESRGLSRDPLFSRLSQFRLLVACSAGFGRLVPAYLYLFVWSSNFSNGPRERARQDRATTIQAMQATYRACLVLAAALVPST